jgi:hypothetical protein
MLSYLVSLLLLAAEEASTHIHSNINTKKTEEREA